MLFPDGRDQVERGTLTRQDTEEQQQLENAPWVGERWGTSCPKGSPGLGRCVDHTLWDCRGWREGEGRRGTGTWAGEETGGFFWFHLLFQGNRNGENGGGNSTGRAVGKRWKCKAAGWVEPSARIDWGTGVKLSGNRNPSKCGCWSWKEAKQLHCGLLTFCVSTQLCARRQHSSGRRQHPCRTKSHTLKRQGCRTSVFPLPQPCKNYRRGRTRGRLNSPSLTHVWHLRASLQRDGYRLHEKTKGRNTLILAISKLMNKF